MQAPSAPAVAPEFRPGSEFLADLAETLLQSVVNISTSQNIDSSRGIPMPEIPEGSPFKDFFDDFFDRQGQTNRPRRVQSLGSGFVIDAEGIIITNNHVIEGADQIVANFSDGTKLPAELVGHDPKTDVAVLRVKPPAPLKAVSFGDSDTTRVGNWVMAIGNPFGLGGTVTVGIVSARNRDIDVGPYDNFIQTDASINLGNSGGPLFNLKGEVIGINTAIFSRSGGSVGIAFAVPSNLAKPVVAQLVAYGETRRGWLGVRIQEVTEEIAESLGMDRARGALIAGINADGPTAGTGIEPGDVVVSFDGRQVVEMRDLPRIVADTEPGKEVDVMVLRDGEEMTFRVVTGRLEESEQAAVTEDEDKPAENGKPVQVLGLELAAMSEELRKQYSIDDKVEGVVVTAVAPDSNAAERGLVPGVVIVEVAQEPVKTLADVVRRVEEVKKQDRRSVLLLVSDSSGELRYVALRVEG
ncbi:MAG: Do family serine endopeptidase [Hyphomicrobiales bacterium]|nr:Do family serine endopeptidase [Hyphomicrobiales bacterium]